MNSALAGKSTGECFSVASGGSSRCWFCNQQNHACGETPVAARALIRAMVQARKVSKNSALSANYTKAVKLAMPLAGETERDVLVAAGVVGAGGALGAAPSISDAQRTSLLASVAAVEASIRALP